MIQIGNAHAVRYSKKRLNGFRYAQSSKPQKCPYAINRASRQGAKGHPRTRIAAFKAIPKNQSDWQFFGKYP